MKKLFKSKNAFAFVALALVVLSSKVFGAENGLALATALPMWMSKNDAGDEVFQKLNSDQLKKLEEEDEKQVADYYDALDAFNDAQFKSLQNANAETLKELASVQKEISAFKTRELEGMKQVMKSLDDKIADLEDKGISKESSEFKTALKKHFDDNSEMYKSWVSDKEAHKGASAVAFKATQTYGDIIDGEDFAQMRTNIENEPVRRVVFRSLFRTIPMVTEYYKYPYQSSVTRDAQNVAKCTSVTSTTKEQITVGEITYKKIKDRIDFCLDFVMDYRFMESRIRFLLNESIALRVDQQILLGSGAGDETNSIDSYASEFSAINPECNIGASIQDANMVDLILGMQTQIVELGEQGKYMPDTVIVNLCDWFKEVESRKNADGNYITEKVSVVNGVPFIGGMRVITSPLVAANTLYVFDSTKGNILDRMDVVVNMAFENGTNWENDIVSMKGSVKLNFFVDPTDVNAFMKCSDVTTAIAAIDKP